MAAVERWLWEQEGKLQKVHVRNTNLGEGGGDNIFILRRAYAYTIKKLQKKLAFACHIWARTMHMLM